MKRIGTILIVALIVVFSYLIYDFVSFRERYAVSDAAFVRSDSLSYLGFKVGGKIIELPIKEGDRIKKDQVLAKIDPKDFLLSKKRLQEELQALQDRIEAARIGLEKTKADVNLAIERSHLKKQSASLEKEALLEEIEAMQAKLAKLKKDQRRYEQLWRQRLIPKSQLETIATETEMLQKRIASLRKRLDVASKSVQEADVGIKMAAASRIEIKRIQKEIEAMVAKGEALKKSIAQIDEKIAYSTLKAPFDAVVAKKFVNANQVVKRGAPIVAIVDPAKLHIEVLLSEKKLKGVKIGNDVKITIDAFKDRKYRGKVQKILPASAATFALVPRDIASGEFTKLDQRFVVRISIENPTPDLRVGMGASVAIKRD